jgi:hypothetical protein
VKQGHSDAREQRGRPVRAAPRRLEQLVVCSSEAADVSAYELRWLRDGFGAILAGAEEVAAGPGPGGSLMVAIGRLEARLALLLGKCYSIAL